MPTTTSNSESTADREGSDHPLLSGRVAILHNNKSGKSDAVSELIGDVVGAVLNEGGKLAPVPMEAGLGEQLDAVRGSSLDLVIAIGGDGTVNASAQVAIDSGAALLVLPAGTMDMVARDLGLPQDPVRVASGIRSLRVVRTDYASVGEWIILHSAIIGLIPRMSELREAIRKAEGPFEKLERLPAFLEAAMGSEIMDLVLSPDGVSSRHQTRCVVVVNNPLAFNQFLTHHRATLDAGRLGVYASEHQGPLGPAKLMTALATGTLADDPEVSSAVCERLEVTAERPTISVAIDGEVRELTLPLTFKSHSRGLRVAIPTEFLESGPA